MKYKRFINSIKKHIQSWQVLRKYEMVKSDRFEVELADPDSRGCRKSAYSACGCIPEAHG